MDPEMIFAVLACDLQKRLRFRNAGVVDDYQLDGEARLRNPDVLST